MDNRKALQAGVILDFPGMQCSVEYEIGRGSNAIVYQAWYPDLLNRDQKHIVLVKELFPLDTQGRIRRGVSGNILCDDEALEHMRMHRDSFERGNAAHLALLEKNPDQIGANLNTFALNNTKYTVLGYSGGRSLNQELKDRRLGVRDIAVYMNSLLDALQAFHDAGYLHLDIAPDNILLVGKRRSERIVLIDYNSVFDVRTVRSSSPTYFSIKQGYTAPEIRTGKTANISYASDLYSVCAVFYFCLTGEVLTPFQMIRPTPPDVSGCECLRDLPDTVRSMVQQILQRGLQTMPRRRYQSIQQMRDDIQELLDRIDDVGVTHWALWEAGRRNVSRAVRENPALKYLQAENELFPTNTVDEAGEIMPIGDCIQKMLTPEGENTLITAAGGMGKTTAMLRAVLEQGDRYSPARPVVTYISLYGWKEGSASYIQDRILENLRFSRETKSFEDARHALKLLLNRPLKTRSGDGPCMLILLDGLNEASGATQPLMEEILELSKMAGVRMLLSSRSDVPSLKFARVTLSPLTGENVNKALADKGLLPPESPEVYELLKTPLMLSIFMKSAIALGKQLRLQSSGDLMQAYFEALRTKEVEQLPQDAPERWQVEAALSLVLPAIAGKVQHANRALNDQELFQTVQQCYKLISSRMMRSAFPGWIGRSREIRGEARDAEEWYGRMVHDLLWKRLGLLVRDEQGAYQIAHQMIGEYLADQDRNNQKRLVNRRRALGATIAAVLMVLILAGTGIYLHFFKPVAYDDNYAQSVFEYGLSGYLAAGNQYDAMRTLVNSALENPAGFPMELELYRMKTASIAAPEADSGFERTRAKMDKMMQDGDVFSWSGKALDADRYWELMGLYSQREAEYARYVDVLEFVMMNPDAAQDYAAYPHRLSELIDADADITGMLYGIVYNPHLVGRYDKENPDGANFEEAVLVLQDQDKHLAGGTDLKELDAGLAALQDNRGDIVDEIYAIGAMQAYENSVEGE